MSIGWVHWVYRQTDGGMSPANNDSENGELLARWEDDLGGRWFDELLKAGHLIGPDDGGPGTYTAKARDLRPVFTEVRRWRDELEQKWGDCYKVRTNFVEWEAVEECAPDEWLIVWKNDADWDM